MKIYKSSNGYYYKQTRGRTVRISKAKYNKYKQKGGQTNINNNIENIIRKRRHELGEEWLKRIKSKNYQLLSQENKNAEHRVYIETLKQVSNNYRKTQGLLPI